MLTPEQVQKLKTAGYSDEKINAYQIKKFGKPTFLSSVASDLAERQKAGAEIVERTGVNIAEATTPLGKAAAAFQGGFQAVGEGAGFLGDVLLRGLGAVTPDFIEKPVVETFKGGVEAAASTETGQKLIKGFGDWAAAHPDAAKNLESLINLAGVVPATKAIQVGAKGVQTAGKAAVKAAGEATEAVTKAAGKAADVAKGAVDIGRGVAESVARVPGRVAINVAERRATQETIRQLPSKTAQEAAKEGIDVADVKFLYTLPKSAKAPLKKLATITKDFAEGKTKTNPIEVVGKPIVNRIKQLESTRGTIGQKLGEVANKLGKVTPEEAQPAILSSLQKVPGLSGLKVTMRGALDFTDTSLATALSKAEREAIRKIYTEAISAGSGKSKHLLRQELFEILGGKKRSLQQITDTQEKAFEAIRKGLSDVLEGKDATYKKLSNDYRKVIQPLQDIRKFMKNVAGADEDILDMAAGLLARRITSNAASNPQLRAILRSMDKATRVKGKTQLDVESLQDFYNVLEKYYDIAAKTGFKGQIKSAIEGGGGFGQRIAAGLEKVAGETPAVRQKALERLIEEVLK